MIAGAIILFSISALAFFMSLRALMEKGFLFNNAYIYASKEEREALNKKPYYRQSAVVFLLVGLIFLLLGLDLIFMTSWIFLLEIAVVIAAISYAIISSVNIEKNNKLQGDENEKNI